jgi:hypothetical protein
MDNLARNAVDLPPPGPDNTPDPSPPQPGPDTFPQPMPDPAPIPEQDPDIPRPGQITPPIIS